MRVIIDGKNGEYSSAYEVGEVTAKITGASKNRYFWIDMACWNIKVR